MNDKSIKIDPNEFELPETTFSHDVENKVFQGIILQCLAHIEGISLVEGNIIDSILGRSGPESIKGITAEQDSHSQSVKVRIEINICYGNSIPDKAEEIQAKIAEEITRLTGLHISSVHIVFKNVIPYEQLKKAHTPLSTGSNINIIPETQIREDYSDEF